MSTNEPAADFPEVLTTAMAAELLHVHVEYLRRMVREGRIPAHRHLANSPSPYRRSAPAQRRLAQLMHVVATGRAARRAAPMSWPQRSHRP